MYSHHASLAWFRGMYFAMWSSGRVVARGSAEDKPGQRVMLSTSAHFLSGWQTRVLVDSMSDEHGERVLTAAGFYVDARSDRLVAFFGNYGPQKEGTQLWALTTTDGTCWTAPQSTGLPVNPNHPPERMQSGRLIISGNISFPFSDDESGLDGWTMGGIYPETMKGAIKDDPASYRVVSNAQGWEHSLCEGSWYQTDDGVLHMLLRNTAPRGGEWPRRCLWETQTRDGASWSEPRETSFSDTNSKFHLGRLPDGRYYYVGNPVGRGRFPLVLSLSRDGVCFDQHFVLGEDSYQHMAARRSGEAVDGGAYGYPHTIVRGGWLHVIVSRRKEAIQVIRVALTELDDPSRGRTRAPGKL